MLFLQRQGEAVDDGAEDLEELGDSVESFGLVYELEEDVVNRSSDVRPEVQKLAVDSVERGFQEIPLARVFRVEKIEQLWSSVFAAGRPKDSHL